MSKNDSVLHWYDFLCPFCYVGQSRTAILRRHGLDVVELPFQAHPDIPANGIPVEPRRGEMYSNLEREAKEAGLLLNWPSRLPNTRHALAAAEWVRRNQPHMFTPFQKTLFAATLLPARTSGTALSLIDTRRNWQSISTLSMPLCWMGPLWRPSKNPRRWAANTAYAAHPPGSLGNA